MPSPRFVFAVLALSAALPLAAHADPITFTETVTASGDFNGSPFTDQLITLTGSADTSAITHAGGIYQLDLTSATLQIGAGPVYNFTTQMDVFSNQNPTAAGGFSSPITLADLLDTQSTDFATYALTGNLVTTGTPLFNYQLAFSTDGGDFDLTDVSTNSAFSAAFGATPEPSSLLLLATGFAGAAWFGRRKFLHS